MKRQTKKGPRRSRAMPVRSKRVVVTDYDGNSNITAGKVYKLEPNSTYGVAIRSDIGLWCYSYSFDGDIQNQCSHLKGRKWRWATL